MTGFNWKKADAWRQHPLMTGNMKHAMPGFLLGAAAFTVYVVYDQVTGGSKKGHH